MSPKRERIDRLFRGDSVAGVSVPNPGANTSLVAHILYLGGFGRLTCYTSTTDSRSVAGHFAGRQGRIWATDPGTATGCGAKHIPLAELRSLLRGFGKGKAKWNDPWEVAQARAYVEQWREHILDWKGATNIEAALLRCFR